METAHQFGSGNHLVGVMSRPGDAQAQHSGSAPPALILLSAGLLHKVGPSRFYALLARSMATKGFTSFRFDLSGIGDSAKADGSLSAEELTHEDVAAAMDLVTAETGIEGFVLGGLCSGAEDAFRVAGKDRRVRGVLMLDGHAYETTGHVIRHFIYRCRRRFLMKIGRYYERKNRKTRTGRTNYSTLEDQIGHVHFPEREWVESNLKRLLQLGTRVHYIYSGSWEYFNYKRQFKAMLPNVDLGEGVTLNYFPEMDHVMSLESDRRRMTATISQWLLAL